MNLIVLDLCSVGHDAIRGAVWTHRAAENPPLTSEVISTYVDASALGDRSSSVCLCVATCCIRRESNVSCSTYFEQSGREFIEPRICAP